MHNVKCNVDNTIYKCMGVLRQHYEHTLAFGENVA